jgi:succinate dehydrogenase/fumarate reductase flavoprotein subunit
MLAYHEAQTDVLVIGGGIAGAFAAIKAREGGVDVVLVDKVFFGRGGCSALASGVYQVYMPGDDLDQWVKGSCSEPFVNRRLAEKAILRTYDCVMEMDRWGVKWIKEGGKIVREYSGGGGLPFKSNAMMAEGGPQMMMALRGEALRKGVRVVNRVMITDLLTSDGRHPTEGMAVGAVGLDTRTAEPWVFEAKATVVSTGPYGFPYTPMGLGFQQMPMDASADGIATMLRAGAILGKMEIGRGNIGPVEFRNAPALEMLGGLGCRFVNDQGEDILSTGSDILSDVERKGKYTHSAAIQGRRSALGNSLARETKAGRNVYMDCTHFTAAQHRLLRQVIPIVVSTYERAGYDLSKDAVPYWSTLAVTSGVSGAGARINEKGETSIKGLYAAGNCSDGAYIRMGQALPGSSVVGAWAGERAAEYVRGSETAGADRAQAEELVRWALTPLKVEKGVEFEEIHARLRRLYIEVIDHVLDGRNIEHALETACAIKAEDSPRLSARDPHELTKVNALKNFLDVFELALMALSRRKESRGNVLRADCPETDNAEWAKFTVLKKEKNGIRIWEEPIPEDEDHLPFERKKTLHSYFR